MVCSDECDDVCKRVPIGLFPVVRCEGAELFKCLRAEVWVGFGKAESPIIGY